MLTVTFSDPSFNGAFAEHGGWADYGEHIGGGLFLLRDIRLGPNAGSGRTLVKGVTKNAKDTQI